MVTEKILCTLLEPWLGSALLSDGVLSGMLAAYLNGSPCTEENLKEMSGKIDRLIFKFLREQTGGDMRVRLDDGCLMRVLLSDIENMADEVLYEKLKELPRDMERYRMLRDYAMEHDSMSALRTLYTRFASFQTQDELQLIARTIREGYPPFRWRQWLDEIN